MVENGTVEREQRVLPIQQLALAYPQEHVTELVLRIARHAVQPIRFLRRVAAVLLLALLLI